MRLLFLLLLVVIINLSDGAKILCVTPIPSRSHSILMNALCEELAERKHQVTSLTSFPILKSIDNYEEIVIGNVSASVSGVNIFQLRDEISPFKVAHFILNMCLGVSEKVLGDEVVQKFLKSPREFDLILIEAYGDESIIAGLTHKYKAPVVGLGVFMTNFWMNNMLGNPAPYSYTSDPFVGLDTRMNFVERLWNTIHGTITEIGYRFFYLPKQDAILKKYFGNDLPPVEQFIKNISLIIVNHHFSLAYSRPYVPNMIEVGGMHVRKTNKLPQDIQTYIDDATDGVIFFSLGSHAQSIHMSKEKLQVFLIVFAKLKQKILWKWEGEDFPEKPPNVKTGKWLPQSDILAHPNVKLFITHGGLGSIIETVHHGVPFIGIPVYVEQPGNMIQAEKAGYGRKIDYDSLTVDILYTAINDVLTDPKYRETVKKHSNLMKDKPLPAMDTAMFWIEYVIRHKGAPHLRSAAQDLSWYQLYLIDVLFTIIAIILVMFYINYLVIKYCLRLFRNKRSESKKKME